MKSRSKELLDRSIAAMIAAIEVYNKPSFPYRAETFSILAINSCELLFKAKWLSENGNKERSLFVFESHTTSSGTESKKQYVKKTRSGNPFTHSVDHLGKKLVEQKKLDPRAWDNIEALMEMRDCAVHFFSNSPVFAVRLQEVGAACLKNFVAVIYDWFRRDLAGFNLYLMPLSFFEQPKDTSGIMLNAREQNYITFLEGLEKPNASPSSLYSVTVNIEVKFSRSKAKDALAVQITKDSNATAVRLTEEQIRESYPWDYDKLTKECQKRYADFKIDQQYHTIRKRLSADSRFGVTRYLDPGNPKSPKKAFFNPNILNEFDKSYHKANGKKTVA